MLQLPAFYSTLKPFRGLFESGRPFLMYHKLAPKPGKARIKGLYVNPRLFDKQLAELAEAGYTTPAYGIHDSKDNAARTICLTFDDGFQSAFTNGLPILTRHKFRGIQFLVADRIGQFNEWEVQLGDIRESLMNESQIREWLAAGNEIGAHSLTHPYLTRVSYREAREEVISSKKKLEDMFGVPVVHFCFPYGDCNEAIRDLVCEAGFQTSCTTEFGVNSPETSPFSLRRIMARHRTISIKSIKASLKA